MAPRLIDIEGLRARGITHSVQQIVRWMGKGAFPRAIMLGRKRAWVETEVDAWVAARIVARDQNAKAA
jgi:prophage regulatory protein